MSKFQLVLVTEDSKPFTFPVSEFGLFIGRSKSMDIPIEGNTVSRRHARVWTDSGSLLIEDLSSRNGIAVNGELVRSTRLKEGDRFLIGNSHFHVVNPDKPLDPSILVAPPKPAAPMPQHPSTPLQQPRPARPFADAPKPALQAPAQSLASNALARAAALHALALDWKAIVNDIARESLNIVPASRAFLIDAPTPVSVGVDVLATCARRNPDGPPINDMLIDRVVRRKEAARSGDTASDVTTLDIGLPQGGAICAPLFGRDACLAVLYLDAGENTSLQFSDENLLALADFARYAAPALENAVKHRALILLARQSGAEETAATVRNALTPILAELKSLHGAPALGALTQRLQTLLATLNARPQRH